MHESDVYQNSEELEQALRAAFRRAPAPDNLIVRVEQRLLAARRAPRVPGFRLLQVPARTTGSNLWSMAAHAAVFALVGLLIMHGKVRVLKTHAAPTQIDVTPFVPISRATAHAAGGGGGGGAHDMLQAPKGKLPKFEQQPITPPMLAVNEHPRLVQEPSIVMPKDLQLPPTDLLALGDPRSNVVGPASNGIGDGAGMGTGSGGGIGSGRGNGYGPGEGGGYGSGIYHVGGGVAAPQLTYSVDPEFSDEARRAKYQGMCVVSLIVDAQGNAQRVAVVRHLGMGLDQKAVAAVKQYKFKPATFKGKPVPVEVNIEVNFRIY